MLPLSVRVMELFLCKYFGENIFILFLFSYIPKIKSRKEKKLAEWMGLKHFLTFCLRKKLKRYFDIRGMGNIEDMQTHIFFRGDALKQF